MNPISYTVPTPTRDELLRARRSPYRFLLIPGAVVAAIAHIPVIGPHLREATYMGVLFIVLTVALLVLATAALIRDSGAVYLATILTCALAIIGYAATRTVAFPQLADDVGNWLEPLGVVCVLSEALTLVAGIAALRRPLSRPPQPQLRQSPAP
jgi:cytochrome bd-type quinol oxidase subunit 2